VGACQWLRHSSAARRRGVVVATTILMVATHCDCKLSHRVIELRYLWPTVQMGTGERTLSLNNRSPAGEGNLQFGPKLAAVSKLGQPVDFATAAKNRDLDLNGGTRPNLRR
jgi:hypothetical protein